MVKFKYKALLDKENEEHIFITIISSSFPIFSYKHPFSIEYWVRTKCPKSTINTRQLQNAWMDQENEKKTMKRNSDVRSGFCVVEIHSENSAKKLPCVIL